MVSLGVLVLIVGDGVIEMVALGLAVILGEGVTRIPLGEASLAKSFACVVKVQGTPPLLKRFSPLDIWK